MRYPPIPAELFIENRSRLASAMQPNSIAVFNSADVPVLSADGSGRFVQNSDLFYLSGVDQEESVLLLFPDAKAAENREILFVKKTSELIAVWEGQKLDKEQAAQVSGIAHVEWLDELDHTLRALTQKARKIYLNYNEHGRASSPVETADDRFRKRCQSLYPTHQYLRPAPLLHQLRVIKSEVEISLIQQACDITEAGFRRVLTMLKPGTLEYEIEAEYAHEFLRVGSKDFAYQPIIASGERACVLHYLSNDQVCADGDMLLMDVGAEFANYNADMTRTAPVNGRFSSRQRAVYDAVHRTLRICIDELIKPGVKIKAYQLQAAQIIEHELLELGLLDKNVIAAEKLNRDIKETQKSYRQYFMHGVSHSLGLDVHDVTSLDPEFAENMVFTVEPGIYIREEGLGVRLENNIVIKESGNLDLMANIPINPDEIEDLMNA
ncbi:MAG: aminopeptidase P N-terminal domain-containing protein [Verrucomicrobiales bacterium]|nr:aminopeptidase P N-terminal domain-containing protein [Verrucomicrobiales bacterium]